MPQLRLNPHRMCHFMRELGEGIRLIRPDIELLVPRGGHVDAAGDHRRDVVNVAERPGLRTVAENRHAAPVQDLVHENADDIAVAVSYVLPRPVHVVGPEDDVVEAEHRAGGFQFLFDGQLGNPVGIIRMRNCVLGHRQTGTGAVDGD
jgi:hypothetical protein